MLRPPEVFETARLVLRRPRGDDAPALFEAYASDAGVTRFLLWRAHADVAETEAFLGICDADWESGESFPFVIGAPPAGASPFGMIHLRPTRHGVDCGYVLARAHWGEGYMTEALRALTDWCFDQPSVFRVAAFCDVDNPASARVMEKAGMQFEGLLRRYNVHPNIAPEPRDVRLFARVRA